MLPIGARAGWAGGKVALEQHMEEGSTPLGQAATDSCEVVAYLELS
jgi:hypothetical protein